jgi:hypothetical protein
LPTGPYHPEENGKQERSGGYCKHNAYRKGQRFESLEEHNAHLHGWNQRWARTRVHGTTRRQVYQHFLESDLPALRPCAADDFALFACGTRKVHSTRKTTQPSRRPDRLQQSLARRSGGGSEAQPAGVIERSRDRPERCRCGAVFPLGRRVSVDEEGCPAGSRVIERRPERRVGLNDVHASR